MMTKYLLGLLVLLGATVSAQQSAPELPFESVPDFLKLPAGTNFGEVSDVAVNSKGHVFVFHDRTARRVRVGAARLRS